jgi:hypothetical protein
MRFDDGGDVQAIAGTVAEYMDEDREEALQTPDWVIFSKSTTIFEAMRSPMSSTVVTLSAFSHLPLKHGS